ncbi:hypothetical protein [Chryseobacterium sp. T1]
MKQVFFIITLLIGSIIIKAQTTQPIIIVNDVVVDRLYMAALDPKNIETVQVYKAPTEALPQLSDMTKNGIINIKLKEASHINNVPIWKAKAILKLPADSQVFLNNIIVNNEEIKISEELLKRAKIIHPDSVNKLPVTIIYLETGQL